jgi:hypothetical protein
LIAHPDISLAVLVALAIIVASRNAQQATKKMRGYTFPSFLASGRHQPKWTSMNVAAGRDSVELTEEEELEAMLPAADKL